MNKLLPLFLAVVSAVCAAAPLTCLGDETPKIAWRRPLYHPGARKNNVDIDDGYWQSAPAWAHLDHRRERHAAQQRRIVRVGPIR